MSDGSVTVKYEKNTAQKPSIARNIHFVPPTENVGPNSIKVCAGLITAVNEDGTCQLVTFGPSSIYFHQNIAFSEEYKPGCWTWPPRV